jgi:hypothetical protein
MNPYREAPLVPVPSLWERLRMAWVRHLCMWHRVHETPDHPEAEARLPKCGVCGVGFYGSTVLLPNPTLPLPKLPNAICRPCARQWSPAGPMR